MLGKLLDLESGTDLGKSQIIRRSKTDITQQVWQWRIRPSVRLSQEDDAGWVSLKGGQRISVRAWVERRVVIREQRHWMEYQNWSRHMIQNWACNGIVWVRDALCWGDVPLRKGWTVWANILASRTHISRTFTVHLWDISSMHISLAWNSRWWFGVVSTVWELNCRKFHGGGIVFNPRDFQRRESSRNMKNNSHCFQGRK